MRTFYIFNVSKEMEILLKKNPYMLYKSFESIYKSDNKDIHTASNLYDQLTSNINKKSINQKIIYAYKNSDFYTYISNHHKYYNKYKNESCDLYIKNRYLLCKANSLKPAFLNKLSNLNYFICDFENKDYFWLDEIYC